jgi:hypothetical protein
LGVTEEMDGPDVNVNADGKDADWLSAFVTVMETVPVFSGGETALISVELATVTAAELTPPNATLAPVWKPVPVIVTTVPPVAGPDVGEIPEIFRVLL